MNKKHYKIVMKEQEAGGHEASKDRSASYRVHIIRDGNITPKPPGKSSAAAHNCSVPQTEGNMRRTRKKVLKADDIQDLDVCKDMSFTDIVCVLRDYNTSPKPPETALALKYNCSLSQIRYIIERHKQILNIRRSDGIQDDEVPNDSDVIGICSRVLRDYNTTPTPTVKELAAKYCCSESKIRYIIKRGKQIVDITTADGTQHLQEREKQIKQFDRIMYEFLERIVHFRLAISEEIVREKALIVQKMLGIKDFCPNSRWLEQFKKSYGITGFDIRSLCYDVRLTEEKQPYLDAKSIIEYVKQLEDMSTCSNKSECTKKKTSPERSKDESDNAAVHLDIDSIQNVTNNAMPIAKCQIDESETLCQDKCLIETDVNPQRDIHCPNSTTLQEGQSSKTLLPEIETTKEALRILKVLEQYAFFRDNFRAVDLLLQLEHIFAPEEKKSKEPTL